MDQDPSCLIRVSPGDSIQEVIDHAPLGAVIELAPGTYRTNLSIGKSLMLRGGGQTPEACRIEGDAKRVPAIEIANMAPVWQRLKEFAEGKRDDWDASPEAMRAHVALENLTCRSQQGAAVGVGGATDIELRSCCLVDSVTGLATGGSGETPEPLRRVLDQLDREQKTKLFGAVNLTPIRVAMSDCTITRNEYGIKVSAANVRLTATDCRIAESEEYGVLIKGSHPRVELLRCSISSGRTGVYIENSETYRVALTECTIEETCCGLGSGWSNGEIELHRNRFLNNRGVAINGLDISPDTVRGSSNEMRGNLVDAIGFVAAAVREPLVPPTKVRHLSVPRDYETVQEAVDAVASGGIIELAGGTYPGGITIWKPLTITGCGRQSTVLDEGDISILPEAKDVCLQDLTLQGGARFPDFKHQGFIHVGGGVRLDRVRIADAEVHMQGGHAFLESCQIDGGRTGIDAWWGEAHLRDCTVSGNLREGIFLGRGTWRHQAGPMRLTLESCSIAENGDGIWACRSGGELVARKTSFSLNTDRGVGLDSPDTVIFEECEISNNGRAGFEISNGSLSMRDCVISGNQTAGIYLRDARAEIRGCKIVENGRSGLVVNTGTQADLRFGEVMRNGEDGVVAASPMSYERDSSAAWTRSAPPQISLSHCRLLQNERHGVFVSGDAQASLSSCEVADNGADGMQVEGRAAVWLGLCHFLRNRSYGIRAVAGEEAAQPASNSGSMIERVSASIAAARANGGSASCCAPLVSGTANTIPSSEDENANEQGALYPKGSDWPWPAGLTRSAMPIDT